MLNSVVKISLMFAQYFEYYAIIVGGGVFSWTHCTTPRFTASTSPESSYVCITSSLTRQIVSVYGFIAVVIVYRSLAFSHSGLKSTCFTNSSHHRRSASLAIGPDFFRPNDYCYVFCLWFRTCARSSLLPSVFLQRAAMLALQALY